MNFQYVSQNSAKAWLPIQISLGVEKLENILKWLNNIAMNSSTQASVFKIRCLRLRGTIEAYTNRFGRIRRCLTQCTVCPTIVE